MIRASGEPSKVAPPPVTADASSSASKFSYDRFGDAGKDEQVVRREEKPVDLSKAAPRTVLPGAPIVTNVPASKSLAYSGSTAGGNPPSAIGEPRRVRTVPIRPEQGGDVASAPPSQQPPMTTTRSQANAQAQSAVAPEPAPRASSRVAMRAAAASGRSGALRQRAVVAQPRRRQQCTAAADARRISRRRGRLRRRALRRPPGWPRRRPRLPRPAAAIWSRCRRRRARRTPRAPTAASSRNTAACSAASRITVRRADLGTKGVYYRAMIGPFGTREAAVQLCSSLKQAGGDCVVQH